MSRPHLPPGSCGSGPVPHFTFQPHLDRAMLPGTQQLHRLLRLPCGFLWKQVLKGRTLLLPRLPGHGHLPCISFHALHPHLELVMARSFYYHLHLWDLPASTVSSENRTGPGRKRASRTRPRQLKTCPEALKVPGLGSTHGEHLAPGLNLWSPREPTF